MSARQHFEELKKAKLKFVYCETATVNFQSTFGHQINLCIDTCNFTLVRGLQSEVCRAEPEYTCCNGDDMTSTSTAQNNFTDAGDGKLGIANLRRRHLLMLHLLARMKTPRKHRNRIIFAHFIERAVTCDASSIGDTIMR